MKNLKNIHIEDISLILSIFLASITASNFFIAVITTALIFYLFQRFTKNKKSKKKIYYISSVILLLVALSNFGSSLPEDTVNEPISESQEIISEPVIEIAEVPQEITLESQVQEALGKNTIIDGINIEEDTLYIEYQASENFTNAMMRRGIMIDAIDIMESIQEYIPEDINEINISSSLPLTDVYGNTSQDKVGLITFNRSTWEKINWEGFITDNLSEVADYFWIHKALQN